MTVMTVSFRFPSPFRRWPCSFATLAIITAERPGVNRLLYQWSDCSIGSLHGELVDQLIRDQVRQERDGYARQKRLENLLISAYRALDEPNHLDSITGFGEVAAGILTAFIADIDNVHTAGQLVNYFGVLPIEVSSGVDRDGKPRGPKRYVISRRGNDLVRRYLWMAALSASRHNPACRSLYAPGAGQAPGQAGDRQDGSAGLTPTAIAIG
jgi:hypothetical protein